MKGTVLGIAGVGLIGGSIALRAHALGATVIGFDSDPAALRAATASGAIDEVVEDLGRLAERCPVIAIALPVDATVAALSGTPELARAELVFDVASVKLPIVGAANALPNFVASHPLAGRERGGFGAADAALFDGRTWAVVPALNPTAQSRLEGIVSALGARPLILTAADHDRLVAISSHLPQLLSVVLGDQLAAAGDGDGRVYDLCGPGMQSMLRLAHSNAALWGPIARANAGALAAALDGAAGALQSIAAELRAGKIDGLLAAFEEAHRAVDTLERSSGAARSVPYAATKR